MDKLLGADTQLLKKDGTVAVSNLPQEGVVGLYYAAHDSPPSRRFTPKLVEIYNTVRANGKKLEIIFVSADKDEDSFTEHAGEQPWLALPYEKREMKTALCKKYKIFGNPTLVLLDAVTGKTITMDACQALSSDPEGAKYPWMPPTVLEAMGDVLVKPDGTQVKATDALKDKTVGLYFSAHWCPPCTEFTPKLADLYNKVKESHPDFEIVFVSNDNDELEFKEYHNSQPWLALPYSNMEGNHALGLMFKVESIPSLVMIRPDGKTINAAAQKAIMGDPEGKEFPWPTKPVQDIEDLGDRLNDRTVCLLLAEGASEETISSLSSVLETYGQAHIAGAGEDGPSMVFGVAREGSETGALIRHVCQLGEVEEDKVEFLIMDMLDEGAFYRLEGEVTQASLKAFFEGYEAKTLKRGQMPNA